MLLGTNDIKVIVIIYVKNLQNHRHHLSICVVQMVCIFLAECRGVGNPEVCLELFCYISLI